MVFVTSVPELAAGAPTTGNSLEMKTTDDFERTLSQEFEIPTTLRFFAEKLGIQDLWPAEPEVQVKLAPAETWHEAVNSPDSLLLVGKPSKNSLAQCYLDHAEP